MSNQRKSSNQSQNQYQDTNQYQQQQGPLQIVDQMPQQQQYMVNTQYGGGGSCGGGGCCGGGCGGCCSGGCGGCGQNYVQNYATSNQHTHNQGYQNQQIPASTVNNYYQNKDQKQDIGWEIQKDKVVNQLIQERENLRIQLSDLQADYKRDVEQVKRTVLQEASIAMERELWDQELAFGNDKKMYTAELNSVKTYLNERDQRLAYLNQQYDKQQQIHSESQAKIEKLKNRKRNLKQELKDRVHEMKAEFEGMMQKKVQQYATHYEQKAKGERNIILQENDHLKIRITELENKLRNLNQMIADIEKFRILVNRKNVEINDLQTAYREMQMKLSEEAEFWKMKVQDQSQLYEEINNLKKKVVRQVQPQIQIQKEFITVQQPIQVEKIVEVVKEIPVERIIRERVAPKQPIVVQEFIQENKDQEMLKLKIQKKKSKIASLRVEVKRFQESIEEYEEIVEQKDVVYSQALYERDTLVAQINQLSNYIKELEALLRDKCQSCTQHTVYQPQQNQQKTQYIVSTSPGIHATIHGADFVTNDRDKGREDDD